MISIRQYSFLRLRLDCFDPVTFLIWRDRDQWYEFSKAAELNKTNNFWAIKFVFVAKWINSSTNLYVLNFMLQAHFDGDRQWLDIILLNVY